MKKSIFKPLLFSLVANLILWSIYLIVDEITKGNRGISAYVFIITLIMIIIVYFVNKNELNKRKKINNKYYSILFFVFWNIFAFIALNVLNLLVNNKLLSSCQSMQPCFVIIQHTFLYLFAIITSIIIVSLEFIYYLYNIKINRKNKQN